MPYLGYGTVAQSRSAESGYEAQARRLYYHICTQGWLGRMWSIIWQQDSHRLLNLAEAAYAKGGYAGGRQIVPINRIQGSATEGRSQDFDRSFRPLKFHNEKRWLSLAAAQLGGVSLPPVCLVKAGDLYYVRDGHHRVSVARALGQQEIEAEVWVWETTRPV